MVLQQITFAIPAFFLVYNRRSELALPTGRTFKLPGWAGWVVNIVTLVSMLVTTAFLFLPAAVPVTPRSMSKSPSEYDVLTIQK